MNRVLLGLTLTFTLLSSTGCHMLSNHHCNNCNGPLSCRPCNLGWQRGGTDYQRFLSHSGGPGAHGAHHAQPAGSGGVGAGPAAQVAYPYYTTRGPRDFLMDNPPTIGR